MEKAFAPMFIEKKNEQKKIIPLIGFHIVKIIYMDQDWKRIEKNENRFFF